MTTWEKVVLAYKLVGSKIQFVEVTKSQRNGIGELNIRYQSNKGTSCTCCAELGRNENKATVIARSKSLGFMARKIKS